MTLRSTTNLVLNPDFKLPRQQMKEGFMYLYNKGFIGKEPLFYTRLWASTLLPDLPKDPTFGKNSRNIRKHALRRAKLTSESTTVLKKVNDATDPHFVVSVPVITFSITGESSLNGLVVDLFGELAEGVTEAEDGSRPTLEDYTPYDGGHIEIKNKTYPGQQVINAAGIDGKGKAQLAKTFLAMRTVQAGSLFTIFFDLKISKDEAQQLTNTAWTAIRNVDLYPLLSLWVEGYFGYLKSAPTASFPVSKIARSLPEVGEGAARVCEYGIAVGPDGQPMYLPKKLDNTGRYEDLFTQAGQQADDTFTLSPATDWILGDEGTTARRLPANIPVLIDWVNYKYAYSDTGGHLKVRDLVRFKAMDVTHAVNIMRRTPLSAKRLKSLAGIASVTGTPLQVQIKPEELAYLDSISGFQDLVNKIRSGSLTVDEYYNYVVASMITNDTLKFIGDEKDGGYALEWFGLEGPGILRPVARFLHTMYQAVLDHLDAVYARYSVSWVSANFALVVLAAQYASRHTQLQIDDETNRAAAINQSVQADWEVPSIPLLNEEIGFLPHQAKVRNLLKDSPAFAILPVQAGGGKTPLAITDILLEIKANRSNPYLVLCPAHLVAQYVKEVAFFTKGKLNVFPLNTTVIRRHGFARLTAMFAKMPRNTVVVVDYDVLRAKAEQVCYGTTNVTVFPVIEFLRQFEFKYALLDESHSIKNDSARSRACMALIADIPKKRLASGTMAHDSPSDMALQIAVLDPTLFGTRDDFNQEYGLEVSGDRVKVWKPGAEKMIMDKIKSRIVVAGAMRKEWAALLPTPKEKMYGVTLTAAQREVYDLIFKETMSEIEEAAQTNKKLAELFAAGAKAEEDPDSVADDDVDGEDIASLLNPYLARIEQYVTAPGKDPLGAKMLKGDDLRSPKVTEIIKLVHEHISEGREGKVLIFTNYTESAEEIFDAFPDDLKAMGLLYVAAEKIEAGAEFENNPNRKWMVGVEQSMNTGLNLQFCSHLIRVETVWNPGTLEQGNSRINRPQLKVEDRRTNIWYSWIVANNTIDVTKIARLISKLVTNAKFENADDPLYDQVPSVPVMKMTLDVVKNVNGWHEHLSDYAAAYSELQRVQIEDFKAYREKHGDLKLAKIPTAPSPEDARLVPDAPYAPGLELYGESKLGLIRIDEYLRSAENETGDGDGDDDEVESDGGDDSKTDARRRELAEGLKGEFVHTEFGDAKVKGVQLHAKTIIVSLPGGYEVRTRFSASFVRTKEFPKGKSTKQMISSMIGLPVAPATDVVSVNFRLDKTAAREAKKAAELMEKQALKRKAEFQESLSAELHITVANGFLGLAFYPEEGNENTAQALEALGFRPSEEFLYAEFDTHKRLANQLSMWEEAGFHMGREHDLAAAVADLYDRLRLGKVRAGISSYNFATKNDLKNFYRMEHKPQVDKYTIKPFPMIEDGVGYLLLPIRGQAGTIPATRIRAPGVRWARSDPSLVYYGLNQQKIGAMVKQVLAAGIKIANIKDLTKAYKKIQKLKIREG